MKGEAQTLFWLSAEKIKIEVPYFQRPYVWDIDEWEDLYSSIIYSKEKNMPFIGSFILQETQEKDKYMIIDGQQRLTTLSIFIKAYLDTFKELPSDSKPEFLNIIYEKTMHNLKSSYKPRLVASQVDSEDFNDVMDIENFNYNRIENSQSRICKAYRFFKEKFENNSRDENFVLGEKILTNSKFFIDIILDPKEDDEQKIFDSVNTLGKDLSFSDIIKNYTFQKLKYLSEDSELLKEKVLDIHKKYWIDIFFSDEKREFWESEKISGRQKTNNLESFLKNFATVKEIFTPYESGGNDGLLRAYKKYIDSISAFADLERFIMEMSEYANCFYDYMNDYDSIDHFNIKDVVNVTLLILDKTETTTFDAYILKLLKEKPQNYLSQIEAFQRFIIQRLVYKATTKNYNKVCETILKSPDPIKYMQQYNDNEPMGISDFPQGLLRIKNKPATLVLFLVELIRRRNDAELYSDVLKYNKTLEHIIPQKWSKWEKVACYKIDDSGTGFIEVTDFSEVNDIRKSAIYSIGNMTLLSSKLNTRVGNETFEVKVEGTDKHPGIRKYVGNFLIAKEIVDTYDELKTWDERNIYDRNNEIFNYLNDYYHFKK